MFIAQVALALSPILIGAIWVHSAREAKMPKTSLRRRGCVDCSALAGQNSETDASARKVMHDVHEVPQAAT